MAPSEGAFARLDRELTTATRRAVIRASLYALLAALLLVAFGAGGERTLTGVDPSTEDVKRIIGVALIVGALAFSTVIFVQFLLIRERLRGIGQAINVAGGVLGGARQTIGALGGVVPGADQLNQKLQDIVTSPVEHLQAELSAEVNEGARLAWRVAFAVVMVLIPSLVGAEWGTVRVWPSLGDALIIVGVTLIISSLAFTGVLLERLLMMRARLRGIGQAINVAGGALDNAGQLVRALAGSIPSDHNVQGMLPKFGQGSAFLPPLAKSAPVAAALALLLLGVLTNGKQPAPDHTHDRKDRGGPNGQNPPLTYL